MFNEEKCKSIPPDHKQALNCVKTALNEKCEKSEEPDPEFVKKCLEIAKANLMRKDEWDAKRFPANNDWISWGII